MLFWYNRFYIGYSNIFIYNIEKKIESINGVFKSSRFLGIKCTFFMTAWESNLVWRSGCSEREKKNFSLKIDISAVRWSILKSEEWFVK